MYSAGIASFTFIVDFSKPVFDGDRGSCLLTGTSVAPDYHGYRGGGGGGYGDREETTVIVVGVDKS